MKRMILFIALFDVFICSNGQVFEVSYYDSLYTKFSNVSFERVLKDSLSDGQYIVFFPKSVSDSTATKTIKETVSYIDNVKNGLAIKYNIENGIHYLFCTINYRNGLLNDDATYFNQQGQVISKGKYLNGKRVGEWMVLHNSASYLLYYDGYGNIVKWVCFEKQNGVVNSGQGAPDFLKTFVNP